MHFKIAGHPLLCIKQISLGVIAYYAVIPIYCLRCGFITFQKSTS